jgi:hypothetical protein
MLIHACHSSSKKRDDNGLVLAKVNKKTLTVSDLNQFTPKGISKADSVILLKKYINKWANDELFYQEALTYLTVEDIDIEKEIENYRKELITDINFNQLLESVFLSKPRGEQTHKKKQMTSKTLKTRKNTL